MRLHTYHRSSAAYRVRIALNLKGLEAEHLFVDLKAGQQGAAPYTALNPQGLIPTLQDGDFTLSQSLAILEYLEEMKPSPSLLPADPRGRARVRQLAYVVACDIHPLQNLRVQREVGALTGKGREAGEDWARLWIQRGLTAFEALVANHPSTGTLCHGDQPTLADLCLVPQLYNASRYGCDLSAMPTLVTIREACERLPAFAAAAPEQQPDAG
jgi:maleylpyruvate isomerase